MVVFLRWCFCGGVAVVVLVFVVVWWCFCGGVVFLWWCFCAGVLVVVWWCFCGGVLCGVFVVVWWCFCGGVFVVVFLWRCSRLSSKTAQSSAEVMAVFKDCRQTSPKVLLK